MARVFVYDGREFPDIDPTMKVDEVRQHYAHYFPELSNAETKESKRPNPEDSTVQDDVYEFKKRVGTKGVEATKEPCRLGHCVTKGHKYGGGGNADFWKKVNAGICPICGGKLVNSPSGK